MESYFCSMLNIGIIGNTKNLEPHVKRIRKNPKINIIGKASVGINPQLNSFHFSIPEFNRIELIERADIILMDNSSLLPFKLLCDIVKKSKHIFTTEYLKLTIEECTQLVKLTNESGSVVQVSNPYYFTPAIQWMNDNIAMPVYIDISHFTSEMSNDSLYPLLMMLLGTTGASARKISAITFHSKQTNSNFYNVRLEFNDASVVNLNYGQFEPLNEFKIKAYSPGKFVTLNFNTKTFYSNNTPINLSPYSSTNEFDTFIETIVNKSPTISSIEDYLIVLSAAQKINKKINQFTVQ